MQHENYGRIIRMTMPFPEPQRVQSATSTSDHRAGTALIMEPRTIRHQERVEDLFYLLFRRAGT